MEQDKIPLEALSPEMESLQIITPSEPKLFIQKDRENPKAKKPRNRL